MNACELNQCGCLDVAPLLCEACRLAPPARFWHGGSAWICADCDLPFGVPLGLERVARWKVDTAARVEANRHG